jgi:hypothetical protein
MATRMELGRRIDEFVRELEEEFGKLPESDEPLITRIEDWAVEIGDAVMAKSMERKLASQSAGSGPECCPTCGCAGRRKGNRRRPLQTRRGKVDVEEVEYYCCGCRKSSFPAVQTAGD